MVVQLMVKNRNQDKHCYFIIKTKFDLLQNNYFFRLEV